MKTCGFGTKNQKLWFHSVVVITSALHAEGPGFNPQWNQNSVRLLHDLSVVESTNIDFNLSQGKLAATSPQPKGTKFSVPKLYYMLLGLS